MLKIARYLLILSVAASATLSVTSCKSSSPRVVLVKPIVWVNGTPTGVVKIGPDPVHVYALTSTGKWELSKNKVSLEGWLAAPEPADIGDGR